MPQFIGREVWLQRFQDYLNAPHGTIWRITGQPGIGKSTLLKQFEHICTEQQRPNIWLDLEGFSSTQGLEVLAAFARAAQFFDTEKTNKSWKEKAGEGFKTVTGGIVGALELSKDLIPAGEAVVGGAKILVGLAEGVAGSAAQLSEAAAAAHPELYLLEALVAAGKHRPVCLLDTYETILRADLTLKSRLVLGMGQAREASEKTYRAAQWLADVVEYLAQHGWRIIVGGREVPRSQADSQLPRFSEAEIIQAAQQRPALSAYIPEQSPALIQILDALSFGGNPLWLQVAMNLLENLLAEGKDLNELAQQPQYLQTCFEQEDPFDVGMYEGIEHGRCKLALIQTLTRSIQDLEGQAWKIALPRVLDKGIVTQLFEPTQANAILHNFNLAGVFRKSGQQFRLHEEIRDLLLAYARSKGWLETEETRALHGKLWEYLNQTYAHNMANYPPLWMAEACYQRVMSGVGLVDKNIDQKTFWFEFGSSTYYDLNRKWQFVHRLHELSSEAIQNLRNQLVREKQRFYTLLGSATTDKLHQDLAEGIVTSPWEINYWQQRVNQYGLVGDYYALQIAHHDPTEKISVIDQLFDKFKHSPDIEAQNICSKMLVNKGWTLSEKLNDPQGAIDTYDLLWQHFHGSTTPAIQESCVKALIGKGLTLGKKFNDPQGTIDTYDLLWQHFHNSTTPAIQESCVKALTSKGLTLGEKFNDPQGAIDTYNLLWQHFHDSTVPAIQEWCAQALYYKGVTLGRVNDLAGAISTFKQLLNAYQAIEHSAIKQQCERANANLAELLLASGQTEEAIPLLQQVLARTDHTQQESVIMPFLLWVADEFSLEQVLNAIRALAPEVTFEWSFEEIRPRINQLPEPKYSQAQCFLNYFENHHQIDQLEQCLANISPT
ncbi:tetratricopeptide repeat protein [Thiofilum flexile]|uniref:tetratricopeptide repeat protein n=1 Tax=Thiofilum flexile TaxID=125627 RepID=UPI000368C79A|nr:tetratricopeptide repeat protein [Thiofilum flexile]